jgi:hypothetical protein
MPLIGGKNRTASSNSVKGDQSGSSNLSSTVNTPRNGSSSLNEILERQSLAEESRTASQKENGEKSVKGNSSSAVGVSILLAERCVTTSSPTDIFPRLFFRSGALTSRLRTASPRRARPLRDRSSSNDPVPVKAGPPPVRTKRGPKPRHRSSTNYAASRVKSPRKRA